MSCSNKSPDSPQPNGRASRDKASGAVESAGAGERSCAPPSASASASSSAQASASSQCALEGGFCESSVVLPVPLGWAAERFAFNFDYDPLARCIYWSEQFSELEKNYIMRYCFDRPSVRVPLFRFRFGFPLFLSLSFDESTPTSTSNEYENVLSILLVFSPMFTKFLSLSCRPRSFYLTILT